MPKDNAQILVERAAYVSKLPGGDCQLALIVADLARFIGEVTSGLEARISALETQLSILAIERDFRDAEQEAQRELHDEGLSEPAGPAPEELEDSPPPAPVSVGDAPDVCDPDVGNAPEPAP